jgi:hypothetical protein
MPPALDEIAGDPPMRRLAAALLLTAALPAAHAQTGEINLLTELGTPFPPGCLSISLPDAPRLQDSVLFDENVAVPSVNSGSLDATIRLRIWRVACADNGYSVVLVRMRQVSDDFVIVPQVFAQAGDVAEPQHRAYLHKIPASGDVGAEGNVITNTGTTWMLAVDPFPLAGSSEFLPADYNAGFTVEFDWDAYAAAREVNIFLDEFVPELDLPQFDDPVLNGRFSGQWVRPGAPRQGLVLQVAEQVDSNFVFAIFFTYLGGQPIWVVGNSDPPALAQPGPVTIAMSTLENGAFISDPNQPPTDNVAVDDAGSITISVIDCNAIRVDYDFSPLGQGAGTMTLDRLVRIAGYDCNPWE